MKYKFEYDTQGSQIYCIQNFKVHFNFRKKSLLGSKLILFGMFLILLIPIFTFSQVKDVVKCNEGIKLYKSFIDYSNNISIDSICVSDKRQKFSIFYNKLTLKEGQQKRKYANGSLWGYKRGNVTFRYFDKGTTFGTYGYHKVIDHQGLIIYSKYERGGYKVPSHTYYFYSKDLNTPLERLTLKNIERDFPDSLFTIEVKKLVSLIELDSIGGLRINRIYNKYY